MPKGPHPALRATFSRKAGEGVPPTKKAKLRRSPSFASLHLSLNCEAGFRRILLRAGITPLLVKPVRRPVLPQTRQLHDAKELAAASFT